VILSLAVKISQLSYKYETLPARDFHTDRPNGKRVTDISYIRTGQGFLYLPLSVTFMTTESPLTAQEQNRLSILCFRQLIADYIHFCNYEHIQLKKTDTT